MSKKVVTLLNKYGPMLSGELARKFEHEYGASNTAARQALSRAKKPVNKICTLSFDKNQKFFYLESQYMSNHYIERLMDAIKQSSQINWVYICAFQSQNGFVAKSILPSLVSSPIKNVKGHKLHQRVIDDLLKCGIIVEYNETHWMLAEWASIQNRSIARAVGLETVKKQVVNDFASWAQNINLIGYDSAKVLSASAEFANFQWALTAPAYIQPLYDTEKIRPGFVVADIFYGRTATEEDINFFLDKLSVIRTFKKLPAFMPVFLVENITREALMILKENKVMVALIKNVFDEKYAKLLAEIVSVFSHSSAIISKNPEKIETLFSEIAKAEGRYNDIIGDMFELLVGYYYQHIGYRYLEIRKLIQIPDSNDKNEIDVLVERDGEIIIVECYQIIKTVDSVVEDESKKIFVFTPERALQLIASFPDLKIDFFFFDEVYKIDEDYCNDELDDSDDEKSKKNKKTNSNPHDFLNEDRGKTFRIALYLLAKSVDEFYLAGPNLNQDRFSKGMKRFLSLNQIVVKEINFEPTLRISVNAHSSKIEEVTPCFLPKSESNELVPIEKKVNDRIKNVVTYIGNKHYGKTLLYCTTPAKAIEYSNKLSDNMGALRAFDAYSDDFKTFLSHIQKEYDIDHSVDEWSLIKVLQNGFGMHHGKLPKYIQQEILDQFNKGTFDVLFCTSTIVEGVNTDAQNMIILNASKGSKKLTPFDIKNIKGRAGRYYHCFIGRVFYMTKELQEIEDSDSMTLNFVTYSDNELSVIDLDNAEIEDLTSINAQRKTERETVTQQFVLPQEVFFKNRTVSKENQEKLLHLLMTDSEFSKYSPLLTHTVDVEGFLHYRWINKILNTFYNASLIDEITCKKFSAIANNYYEGGFKALLGYEVGKYRRGHYKSMDRAYSEAFKSLKDVLEHKIPKILSLFESIVVFVAKQEGIGVETFSLSRVRRYYETGVKSLLGEALIEYGFPTDAIRRIEENHKKIKSMTVSEAKEYCRLHFREVQLLLDTYERGLFIKAMRTF